MHWNQFLEYLFQEVYILEFRHGIWFDKHMDMLLINIDQCRKFGNDPTGPRRKLVMEESEDIFIPMKMK